MRFEVCEKCHLPKGDEKCNPEGSMTTWCGVQIPHDEFIDGYHPRHHPYKSPCCADASVRSLKSSLTKRSPKRRTR